MSNLDVTNSQKDFLTPDERAALRRMLHDPSEFPKELGAWITEYLAVHGELQIAQVEGLRQRFPQVSAVATSEGNAPLQPSWGDLATVGPKVLNLAPGQYLCIFGFHMDQVGGTGSLASAALSLNGSVITESAVGVLVFNPPLTNPSFVQRAYLLNAPLPSNDIKLVYQNFFSGDTPTFAQRFLVTIRTD